MKLNLNKTTKLSIDINIINLKIGDIMAKIGYARVSSKNQNLDRQIESLQGVSKLFVCGKINLHTIAAQKYITPQAA